MMDDAEAIHRIDCRVEEGNKAEKKNVYLRTARKDADPFLPLLEGASCLQSDRWKK